MHWINIIIYLLVVVEYVSFYYVFWGKRDLNKSHKAYWILICMNIIAFMIVLITDKSGIIFFCVTMISSIAHVMLLFKMRFLETIKLFFICFLLLSIGENVIDLFFMNFVVLKENEIIIISMVAVTAIVWGYYGIIGRKIDRNAFALSPQMNILLTIVVYVITFMFTYFTYIISEVLHMKQAGVGILFATCGETIIFILLMAMIYSLNARQKYYLEKQYLEKYGELQKQYFEVLLEKEKETRQFRHDTIAELVQMKNYIKNKDYEALDNYVAASLNEIDSISKYNYDVGNEVVNVLLNYYLLPIKDSCRIEVKGYVPEMDNIEDRDLNIIISNLILNAVEAVKHLKAEDRYIIFKIKRGRFYTFINEENSCREDKNSFETTKADKKSHGHGLKNIKKTVKKYEGEFSYEINKGVFSSEIRIKNDRSQKK